MVEFILTCDGPFRLTETCLGMILEVDPLEFTEFFMPPERGKGSSRTGGNVFFSLILCYSRAES